jgi:hypothetical protein
MLKPNATFRSILFMLFFILQPNAITHSQAPPNPPSKVLDVYHKRRGMMVEKWIKENYERETRNKK